MATNENVLVTITGNDRPGLTAALAKAVAESGAALRDVEQVVLQGRLVLGMSISIPPKSPCRQELLATARSLGVHLEFADIPTRPAVRGHHYVVTAIGKEIGASQLHRIADSLAAHGANIESILRLSEETLGTLELHVLLPADRDPAELKRDLLALAMELGVDLALQREGLYRRSKRLVVMDMDSTLIRIEVIDELARAHGVVDRVSAITERAMQGEMDYDESLRQRVALLAGLDVSVLEEIAGNLPLTEGAETLVRVLKRLGYKVAVLSGGFSVAAEALQKRLGLDYARSNVLEVRDGKLTGNVVGRIVNAERKAELLQAIAEKEGLVLDQVIAVGDGANDLLMLQKAGLGIAFRAKPRLRAAADTSISAAGLDAILYLLGISASEIREATA